METSRTEASKSEDGVFVMREWTETSKKLTDGKKVIYVEQRRIGIITGLFFFC